MTEKSCAACVKRYVNGGHLECRARPPVQDVGRYARYPVVRPDFYCHDGFELDAPAQASKAPPRKGQAAPELPL